MTNSKLPIVALVGRANVGKSSLLNTVIGRREAIVAAEPGTTRDRVIARASALDKDFWLVDTAGLKSASDEFEADIASQIYDATSSANLICVVVEADVPATEEDKRIAKLALKSKRPVILVINKVDKNPHADLSDWQRLGIKQAVLISTAQRTGLSDLLDLIARSLPKAKFPAPSNLIKIGILGRPNVGKSSLLNSLAKKQEALVSATSGTTRDVNRVSLRYGQREIKLMDTAGIRRSGKIERGVEHFSVLRSLAAIEESDICLVLMDINELNVQLDQKIAGMIKDGGKGLILVVTKMDTLEEESDSQNQISARVASNFEFVPWAPLVFTSSLSGQNVTKLFELATEIARNRDLRLKTPELNKWLVRTTAKHAPAGIKNYEPKLRYITQEEGSDPPSFKIFGSKTKYLHFSYKRYLERAFREEWPFAGTPIKFWFIDKSG